ncbi:MAG: hypothetical protein ACRDNW_18165 [Trebonia sp.]
MGNTPGLVALHSRAARLLAVEVLLADPEALADDVLESALYLLRDRLSATPGNPDIPVLDAALFQPLHEVIAGPPVGALDRSR